MYLYGASGHAKVIIDILESQKIEIEGIFDDKESLKSILNYPVYTPTDIKSPLIVSIGDNATRKKITEKLFCEYGTAIHPTAVISPYSSIGDGTVVMQNAVIQSSCNIGKHCIINTSASVDHDCLIEDFVHISPNCTLCGNVQVGEGSWIGAGTSITPGVKIGRWSVIAAGSIVTKDIPNNVLAVGNNYRTFNALYNSDLGGG